MKYIPLILLLLSISSWAIVDADRDGIDDSIDVCPRVYSRSQNGCPTLTPANTTKTQINACYQKYVKKDIMYVSVKTFCDKTNTSCMSLSGVYGYQSCDPIFPVILGTDGAPMIRGDVTIIGW